MKHVIIISVEIILLFCIVIGFILAYPSIAKSQNSGQPLTINSIADIYREALLSPFNKASGELKDGNLSGFYNKFVAAMELDKPTNAGEGEQFSLANLLPDLVKIQRNALTKPLLEAGTGIQDPELKTFYYNFLQRCGVSQ
ncbi:MAG: hypothetical protein PHO26_02215 [Dehalococcoidia bacterium]|nr:hypothetical protein [Dehalococcoidia bacterium]MDD5494590.1 hypothetical protein [Dehalococcoidia bacterium]